MKFNYYCSVHNLAGSRLTAVYGSEKTRNAAMDRCRQAFIECKDDAKIINIQIIEEGKT